MGGEPQRAPMKSRSQVPGKGPKANDRERIFIGFSLGRELIAQLPDLIRVV